MMESLGEILKRKAVLKSTSKGDTDTSSSVNPQGRSALEGEEEAGGAPLEESELNAQCPICKGVGFVRRHVPFGHPDFGRAIPCQCKKREFEEGRLARLQRYSNLGPLSQLTFDNLVPGGRSGVPENQQRFSLALSAARAFAQNPEGWLMFTGVSGCGKTHLAAAIANSCLARGYSAFFISVPDLLDHLRSSFSPNSELSYDELFEQVRNAPLLVLDDLGMQSSTPWAREKLYQIVNHRFNNQMPTVVTTNVSLDGLDERLRTRLTGQALSQVFVVEEKSSPIFKQTGDMGLELLNNMTFESFDWKGVQLTPEQRHSLEQAFRRSREFAESPQGWLVLLGPNGCGKTHLAAAIVNYHLRAGQPSLFTVVPDLLDHFRSTFDPESKTSYDDLFEAVKLAPLLILDDLGTQSSTSWAQEKLYQILNYRYNARLPTVITSSFSLDEIEDRLSSRMGDFRLSTVIGITAPDYRIDRKPAEKPKPGIRRGRRGR